jgi:hypothetical protein
VITVDGLPVNAGPADARGGDGDSSEEALRIVRVEVKLCRALVALSPPDDLSILAHTRAADLLRTLRRHDATDRDTIRAAGLSDGELKEAAAIIRAFRALPSWGAKGFQGGTSFRAVLGVYALDLASEIEARATRGD